MRMVCLSVIKNFARTESEFLHTNKFCCAFSLAIFPFYTDLLQQFCSLYFHEQFSLFPPLQQYGLIYRQRMASFGFDAKQTTTIVNVVMAISSLIGLVNGAMFRRFTFRQVALAGSLLGFAGIFLSAFCVSFVQYLICFSCIYGKIPPSDPCRFFIKILFLINFRYWFGPLHGCQFLGGKHIL